MLSIPEYLLGGDIPVPKETIKACLSNKHCDTVSNRRLLSQMPGSLTTEGLLLASAYSTWESKFWSGVYASLPFGAKIHGSPHRSFLSVSFRFGLICAFLSFCHECLGFEVRGKVITLID